MNRTEDSKKTGAPTQNASKNNRRSPRSGAVGDEKNVTAKRKKTGTKADGSRSTTLQCVADKRSKAGDEKLARSAMKKPNKGNVVSADSKEHDLDSSPKPRAASQAAAWAAEPEWMEPISEAMAETSYGSREPED